MGSARFVFILVAWQCFCASFFLWDILASILSLPVPVLSWQAREATEILAAFGLMLGSYFGVRYAHNIQREAIRTQDALNIATGALSKNVNEQFDSWKLTPAEREVGWLLVKGFSIVEIARVRGTSDGTIKSQSNAIYRKAGVTGRAQLLALFVEDLFAAVDSEI